MKVYYQGIPGAYSHQVANLVKNILNANSTQGCFSFKDVFDAMTKEDGIGVIPIENSYAGTVHQSMYLLKNYDVEILADYFLPIAHCLASKEKNISDVKKAYSHPQALMQCEKFLQENNIEAVEHSDTAASAQYISEKDLKNVASVCSPYAAQLYSLNILAESINDNPNNTTRFLILKPKNLEINFQPLQEKVSLLFKVKDQPAILFKCLGAFATRAINLTKIESIPTQDKNFEYMFWIDFEYPDNEDYYKQALEELKFFTKDLKVLGVYGTLKEQ